jgi:hypothetical protein
MGWHMSDYLAGKMLSHILTNTAFTAPAGIYATLTTTIPTAAGTATEVTGGGYTRQAVTFSTPTSGAVTSATGPSWAPVSTAAGQVIVGVQLMDAAVGGNLLFYYQLDHSVIIPANRNLALPANFATIGRGTGQLSNYAAEKWLGLVLNATAWTPPATVYIAEYTTAVDETGAGTEVTGGGYTRKAATFNAPSNGFTFITADVTFSPLHTGATQNVLATTICDASTAGHVLMFSPIRADGTAIAVPAGDILQHTAFTLKVYANR